MSNIKEGGDDEHLFVKQGCITIKLIMVAKLSLLPPKTLYTISPFLARPYNIFM